MKIGRGTKICDTARVIGNCTLGENCFVLFGAVLRGDGGTISVGHSSNIQDLACLHADPGFPCVVGNNVSVGHGAVVHGCTIGDDTIVGIKSVVLNGARVGRGCIIGAGAVVKEGMVVPDFSLVVGVPGKIVRTNEAFAEKGRMNAQAYQQLKDNYQGGQYHIWRNEAKL